MKERKWNQKYFVGLFFIGLKLTHHETSFVYTVNFESSNYYTADEQSFESAWYMLETTINIDEE